MSKYGIPNNVSGVYIITCLVNSKRYIGSSKNIASRLSTHFGRDAKRYVNREFYIDIRKYGIKNFTWSVLETCSPENLIERERYYYNLIHPEYNIVVPCEQHEIFKQPEVIRRSRLSFLKNAPQRLKALYAKPEYKKLFRNKQAHRFKAVDVIENGVVICSFETMTDCANWITQTTNFTGKNKVSKIKAVCDGERPNAYGFKFRYSTKCND